MSNQIQQQNDLLVEGDQDYMDADSYAQYMNQVDAEYVAPVPEPELDIDADTLKALDDIQEQLRGEVSQQEQVEELAAEIGIFDDITQEFDSFNVYEALEKAGLSQDVISQHLYELDPSLQPDVEPVELSDEQREKLAEMSEEEREQAMKEYEERQLGARGFAQRKGQAVQGEAASQRQGQGQNPYQSSSMVATAIAGAITGLGVGAYEGVRGIYKHVKDAHFQPKAGLVEASGEAYGLVDEEGAEPSIKLGAGVEAGVIRPDVNNWLESDPFNVAKSKFQEEREVAEALHSLSVAVAAFEQREALESGSGAKAVSDAIGRLNATVSGVVDSDGADLNEKSAVKKAFTVDRVKKQLGVGFKTIENQFAQQLKDNDTLTEQLRDGGKSIVSLFKDMMKTLADKLGFKLNAGAKESASSAPSMGMS